MFLGGVASSSVALFTIVPQQTFAAAPSHTGTPNWWREEYRILQTNLREIDVLEDSKEIARAVHEFGATALVTNIGGIVAFYPTELDLQYKNPYLKGDFTGEMIEAA